MLKNQTNSQIVTAALRGIDAVNGRGSMSTDTFRLGFSRYGIPYVGSLPKVWERVVNEAFQAGRISQVIYSYSTAIAWHDSEHGWIIPAVTYSTTTSANHQTHLYRLGGRRIEVPWDATAEDMRRVLSGEVIFIRSGKWGTGNWQGTRPGPNYVAGE